MSGVRTERRGVNTAERKTILTSWWVHHIMLSTCAEVWSFGPNEIADALEEVEASPEACDAELCDAYSNYISQVPL